MEKNENQPFMFSNREGFAPDNSKIEILADSSRINDISSKKIMKFFFLIKVSII